MINLSGIKQVNFIANKKLNDKQKSMLKKYWAYYFPLIPTAFKTQSDILNNRSTFEIYLDCTTKKISLHNKRLIFHDKKKFSYTILPNHFFIFTSGIEVAIESFKLWIQSSNNHSRHLTPQILSSNKSYPFKKKQYCYNSFSLRTLLFNKENHVLFIDFLDLNTLYKYIIYPLVFCLNTVQKEKKIYIFSSEYDLEFKFAQSQLYG